MVEEWFLIYYFVLWFWVSYEVIIKIFWVCFFCFFWDREFCGDMVFRRVVWRIIWIFFFVLIVINMRILNFVYNICIIIFNNVCFFGWGSNWCIFICNFNCLIFFFGYNWYRFFFIIFMIEFVIIFWRICVFFWILFNVVVSKRIVCMGSNFGRFIWIWIIVMFVVFW